MGTRIGSAPARAGRGVVAGAILAATLVIAASPSRAAPPVGTVSVVGRGIMDPTDIVAGGGQYFWFTSRGNDLLGRISPAGGVKLYADAALTGPQQLAFGHDGKLWVANENGDEDSVVAVTLDDDHEPESFAVVATAADGVNNPAGIARGPDAEDEDIWFTNRGSDTIGRIIWDEQADDYVVSVHSDAAVSEPVGITSGPDGNVWFTNVGNDSIVKATTADPPVFTNVTTGATTISDPMDIAFGSDGDAWFTNHGNDSIGAVHIAAGPVYTVENYPSPPLQQISDPMGITAGPDGNLWFANEGGDTIGRIAVNGSLATFSGQGLDEPTGIAAAPEAWGLDAPVWFVNSGNNSIGSITPTGTVANHIGTGIDAPLDIAQGPDGNLWFTNLAGNSIGKVTPDGEFFNYRHAAVVRPYEITAGPDDDLWFTTLGSEVQQANQASTDQAVGRITTDGEITVFTDDHAHDNEDDIYTPRGITLGPDGESLWITNADPGSIVKLVYHHGKLFGTIFQGVGIAGSESIASGPDGNLWFTNSVGDSIGRITPTGVVSNFAGPGIDQPVRITAGSDGALWFTNFESDDDIQATQAPAPQTQEAQAQEAQALPDDGPGGLPRTVPKTVAQPDPDGSIGRITVSGAVWEIDDPTIKSPFGIAEGPGGNIWFVNMADASLGRVITPESPDGPEDYDVENYQTTGHFLTTLASIAPDAQGRMWFTDLGASAIARIMAAAVPGAPTGVTATVGNRQATVTWTAPGDTGDMPITSYTVTAEPGGQSCMWTSGPLSCTLTGLTNGTAYTFTVTATNVVGTGPASSPSGAVTPAMGFTSLYPARLLDTRAGGPTVDGEQSGGGQIGDGQARSVPVLGRGGVPATGVEAVVLNVTGLNNALPSYLTLYPTGQARPATSNVNVPAFGTRPNLAVVEVGAGGSVDIYNAAGSLDVLADVQGWFPTGERFQPAASRILDTRVADEPLGPGSSRSVPVAGQGGVPASGVSVAVLNVTMAGGSADSALTVHPTGGEEPDEANVYASSGQTTSNLVYARLGDDGSVAVGNAAGNQHVIVDVQGWFPAGDAFTGLTTARLMDTAPGGSTVDGEYAGIGPVGPGETVELPVLGRGGVPATGVDSVVLNVTGTAGTAGTVVTVYPNGEPRPGTSNLNLLADDTSANLVTAKVGTGGKVSFTNDAGEQHLMVDVQGWSPS